MRETIIALLKEVRPNIDLRAGSPMYIYLVDALAAIAGKLVDEIESGRALDVQSSADMFFVDQGEPEDSECTVRLYFWSTENLTYSSNQMRFSSRQGASYTNKFPVSVRASAMALYTDDVYFYTDINLTGTTPVSMETEFIWDDATDSFSHIVITNIVSPGSLGLSSNDLSTRITRELALRNNISSPGIIAFLSNMFTSQLKDVLVQGFLDPEMQRDLVGNLHVGGCIDVYVKGTYPQDKTLKFDNVEMDRDGVFAETIIESPATLTKAPLVTCTAETCNRVALNGFANELTLTAAHFDVDLATGLITLKNQDIYDIVHTQILSGNVPVIAWAFYPTTGKYEFEISPVAPAAQALIGDIILWKSNYYLVKYLRGTLIPPTRFIGVDREITGAVAPGDEMTVYEPVRVSYTYKPIGVELTEFDNPLIAIDAVNVLDPLTDEDILDTVDPLPGFGTGIFGAGPYGRGSETGWEFHVDDENKRYSIYEEGFLELPRDTYLERIGVEYKLDPFVSSVQAVLDANRPKAASMIAFAFIPCQVNMSLRILDNVDLTNIRYLIWEMPGEMELSDLNTALYNLGVTKLMWTDFYDTSTYRIWKRDGSFVTVVPTDDGIITLGNLSERFLPQTVEIRTS